MKKSMNPKSWNFKVASGYVFHWEPVSRITNNKNDNGISKLPKSDQSIMPYWWNQNTRAVFIFKRHPLGCRDNCSPLLWILENSEAPARGLLGPIKTIVYLSPYPEGFKRSNLSSIGIVQKKIICLKSKTNWIHTIVVHNITCKLWKQWFSDNFS